MLASITPFFIVRDVQRSIDFYRDALGFEVAFLGPDNDPYFAIVRREGASIMLKAIVPDVQAVPNHTRHSWARWDAYVDAPDPDALAAELTARGVTLHKPLGNDDDGLRGFEVKDPDGYVFFFGRPVQDTARR